MKYLGYTFIASATAFIAGARSVLAQTPDSFFDPGGRIAASSQLPTTPIVDTVLNIISGVLSILAIITLGLIIYAGFLMVTSAGNTDRVSTARSILTWSIIGLLIILSSLGIVIFLDTVLFTNIVGTGP